MVSEGNEKHSWFTEAIKKLEALDEEVQEGGILRHSDADMAAVTLGATQNERGWPLHPDGVADGLMEKDLSGKGNVEEENTGLEEKKTLIAPAEDMAHLSNTTSFLHGSSSAVSCDKNKLQSTVLLSTL